MSAQPARIRNSECGIALAALSCLLLPVAYAQSDDQSPDAVRACQRVSDRLARLDCYDRAFPPLAEPARGDEPARGADSGRGAERTRGADSGRGAEPARGDASVGGDDSPPGRQSSPAAVAESAPTARIVEVQMPSLGTTIFLAADGRTFVRENATTVIRWPDTPFDVEIQTGLFGTSTFLQLPGGSRRVRVVVRD